MFVGGTLIGARSMPRSLPSRSASARPWSPRQAEELAVRASVDFDAFYRDPFREPEDENDLLVLSFDGKGIATLHRDLREATRKKAEKTKRRRHAPSARSLIRR